MKPYSLWFALLVAASFGCARSVGSDADTPSDASVDGRPDDSIDAATGCTTPYGAQLSVGESAVIGCTQCLCTPSGALSCSSRDCADARPPADAGVTCTLPTGEQIPAGASWSSGCNSCRCTETGLLSCTDHGCLDGGAPPADGGVCIGPDGTRIPSGSTWAGGCSLCTCSADATLSCQHDPRCDADGGVYCTAPDGTRFPSGATWSRGCQRCSCDRTAVALCELVPGCSDGGAAGCEAPDGTWIALGAAWSDVCRTCVCDPSGYFLCRPIPGCGVDGGTNTCTAPDGTVIVAGARWSNGCESCSCESGRGLSCTVTPDCDASVADAGICNTLTTAGVPRPVSRVVTVIPPGAGGTIVDGTYVATAVEQAGGSPFSIGAMVMEFARGTVQYASDGPSGTLHATLWYMTSGTEFQVIPVCGPGGALTSEPYTATPTEIRLIVGAGAVQSVIVMTRR